MKAKGRTVRVAALIKEEIAKLLMKGLKDPRIGFVSVMDVRMSNDLRHANVYVSLFGSDTERKSSLVGLRNSAGWIRHAVGKYLHMRVLPEIHFFPDDTLDKVYHLEEVFEEIHAEQQQQPMLNISLVEALDALSQANAFYIVSHQNPDGDAVGSMLALRLLLQAMGKTSVTCALDDSVPRMYQELPGAKSIGSAESEVPEYDLAVLVDCGRLNRIGDLAGNITPDKRLLVLDHHREEGECGASGVVDPSYAATGEIVAELFETAQIPFTAEVAKCLYAAIATDTGCFKFSNTTARTHRITAALLDTGIDAGQLNTLFFTDMARTKFELMRRALERVQFHASGAVALSWLTEDDLAQTGARQEDTENLINYWQNVERVRVAVLLKQFSEGEIRVSMRSSADFDSAAFLRPLGGGGHAPAAGATLEMPLEEARQTLVDALLKQLAQHEQPG